MLDLLGETPDAKFKDRVIKVHMPPTLAAAEDLGVLVDLLCLDARDDNADRHEHEQELRLLAAEGAVGNLSARLRREIERSPVNLLISRDESLEARLAALKQGRDGITALLGAGFFQHAPVPRLPRNREGHQWPACACVLATAFIKALRETNPGVKIGVGKDGPVTRFIAKVMQFITGETPKLGAIEKHLRDHLNFSDIQ